MHQGVPVGRINIEGFLVRQANDDQVVFIETQGLVLHVFQLIEDYERANDHEDGNTELERDQDFPEKRMRRARLERAGQYGHRPEGGQDEGGISTRGDPRHQGNARQGRYQPGRLVVHRQRLAGEQVELGQEQVNQAQCDDEGDGGDQDRLARKLFNQHFPHADFLRSAGGAGGGKVNEIHAGDQQDEDGQAGEDVHVPDTAVRPDFGFHVGMQVDIRDGLQEGPGLDAHGLEQFAKVLVQESGEFSLQVFGCISVPKQ